MGKINAQDRPVIENQKRKYGNQLDFYSNFHLKDALGMEIC